MDRLKSPEVVFLGWRKSAVELVGERLLEMSRNEPDVFRRATVVVPTAESGRRLREWMAAAAGRPLLMPRMSLAGQLIKPRGERMATELETLAAWVEELTAQPPHEAWPELFSHPAPEKHLQTWALSTADMLMRLRLQMEQYEVAPERVVQELRGRDVGDGGLYGVEDAEAQRWGGLKRLFAAVDARLEKWGREPGWKARARALSCVAGVDAAPLIIACLPEISPQVQRYLMLLEGAQPGKVRIWVNAPSELAEQGFDVLRCGQLRPEFWAAVAFSPAELCDEQITIASSAQRMARAAVAAVGSAEQEEVALASCDGGFTPALATEFRRAGWRLHLPEGRSFHTTDLAALPELLARACMAPNRVDALEPLLRNVAARRVAGVKGVDAYSFGKLLDKIKLRYYPSSVDYLLKLLSPALPLPGLRPAVGVLPGSPAAAGVEPAGTNEREVAYIESLRSPEACDYVQWWVSLINACRADVRAGWLRLESQLRRAYARDALQAPAEQMAERLRQAAAFLERRPRAPQQAWALLSHALGHVDVALQESPREKTQLDALGWRELAFAAGQRVIITGFHEGCVPEALHVDSFLPDSLRKRLGMPCAESRVARDAFLLKALLNRCDVRVQIILSRLQADGSGTLVSPSPLLFHCAEDQLAARVQKLFAPLPAEDEVDAYLPFWSLSAAESPAEAEGMESVAQIAPRWENKYARPEHKFSPSDINAFLACPLRFWMKQALGISPGEAYREDKVEMEAAEYGTLLHNVLEDVSRRFPSGRELAAASDGEALAYAQERLALRCKERYGDYALLATQQRQINRLRESLEPFVAWHCETLREGWQCFDCEHQIDGWELSLPDGTTARLSMRADRIDYRPATNEWRIIDYKTHDRKPKDDHLERVPEQKRARFEELMGCEAFPLFELGEKPYRWRDVQLPMYAYWLMHEKGCLLPQVAYFNLPRVDKAPQFTPMEELDSVALESSLAWARQAILLMRAGLCLYSAESLGCKAFGSFSALDDMADPRALFRSLRTL